LTLFSIKQLLVIVIIRNELRVGDHSAPGEMNKVIQGVETRTAPQVATAAVPPAAQTVDIPYEKYSISLQIF